jgi:hypothetical protein
LNGFLELTAIAVDASQQWHDQRRSPRQSSRFQGEVIGGNKKIARDKFFDFAVLQQLR